MKKFIIIFLASCLIFSLSGCGNKPEEKDIIVEESTIEEENTFIEEKIHTIRINGVNYYETNRTISEIEEATENTLTGDIKSFVNKNEFPNEDNQSNFGVGYAYQVKDELFAYLNINGEWHIFCSNEDAENSITFNDRVFLKTELSSSTLEWLEFYNELSEEEQMATDSIPAELIDEILVEVEDAGDMQENSETDTINTENSEENNSEKTSILDDTEIEE